MSEIFDFLKKAENKRAKGSDNPINVPIGEHKYAAEGGVTNESVTEPPTYEESETDIEICSADRFDLTGASPQIKDILDPFTLVGEQFRLLRSKLGLIQKQRGIKTILVTSSIPDEGKTFTASGLASVFAQETEKRVVLIDADMRKPKSGWNFGLNGSNAKLGLSEVLRGEKELQSSLLQCMNPPFYFVPSGPLPSNPSELLSSQNLERTLNSVAANFDWVIIDSPPMMGLSDTSLIAPLCEAVILVVRTGSTPSKLVAKMMDQIGRDRICGVVLNRQKQSHSSRYYYQYYYRSSKRQKS